MMGGTGIDETVRSSYPVLEKSVAVTTHPDPWRVLPIHQRVQRVGETVVCGISLVLGGDQVERRKMVCDANRLVLR